MFKLTSELSMARTSTLQSKPLYQVSKQFSTAKLASILGKENQVLNYLQSHSGKNRPFIITPYHWPDIDGCACAYSMRCLLQRMGFSKAEALISQEPQPEAKWMMDRLGAHLPSLQEPMDQEAEVALVDVSDPMDVPKAVDLSQVKLIIDHRDYGDLKAFKNALPWIEKVGSASTLIGELFFKAKMVPDKISAQFLYGAIMSNTAKCRTHNTTEKDVLIAQWLQDEGGADAQLVDEMFIAKSQIEMSQLTQVLDNDLSSKLNLIAGKRTAVAQLEMVEGEHFIRLHKDQLYTSLEDIQRQRSAERIFLVLIDLTTGFTFFLFPKREDAALLSSKLPLQESDGFFFVADTLTRKEIIAMTMDPPPS